ncbi:hypothetical protein HW115_19195 [Verrucomicrobiaceae bacterium N1E253]|uniref:Uncharacterized protein n=1 Tax=Oceaniferula marina TaxID=2748318 RepID=A0A851GJQ6_9BACT|nr:hypothetical protein [Oceaniferula marina]
MNALEAEFLHQPSRLKVIALGTHVHMTGTLNGLRLQLGRKDIGVVIFDEKKSVAIRPGGLKIPLVFKASADLRWSCKFKDDITHMNMEQGVFVYHLHFTVDGEPYRVVHKLKYTTKGKGDFPSRWVQKESG